MPELDAAQLKKQIAAGELHSLYLITGEEKYLVSREAARLIRAAGGEGLGEFNSQAFTNDSTVDAIADAAEALPVFAERKCVSVADFDLEEKKSDELEKLWELLKNVPDTTTLVFWYPTASPSGTSWQKLTKLCREKGFVLFCARRDAAELAKMLIRAAEKEGCVLSRRNADKLVEYAGQDVGRLLNEMEKLCAYALGRGQAEITGEDIEELVSQSMETTAFILSNALLSGNYEKAYGLLDTLFYHREEPVRILGALSNSYVDMQRVQTALESGRGAVDAAEYGDYNKDRKKTGYRLGVAEKNARRIRPPMLRKSLELLLEADMSLKGSSIDPQLVLEELIAKLLLAAQEDRS